MPTSRYIQGSFKIESMPLSYFQDQVNKANKFDDIIHLFKGDVDQIFELSDLIDEMILDGDIDISKANQN